MKKVSILNFPAEFFEPIKQRDEVPGILNLIIDKNEIIEKDLISKWEQEKIKEEEKFLTLSDPFEGLKPKEELKRKQQEIDDKHAIHSLNLGNSGWDKWRIEKDEMEEEHKLLCYKSTIYWDSKRRIDGLYSQINAALQKSKEIVPMLPTSLNSMHISLINQEIEKYAEQGFELDDMQLQKSEFGERGVLQKYYSSVLMTWRQTTP